MKYAIKKMSPQLLVTNIERSIEFYINKLGFDVDFRYQDFFAGIIKDGYSIHLKMTEHSIKDKSRAKEDIDIMFLIDSIEDLYNDFLNESVEITQ